MCSGDNNSDIIHAVLSYALGVGTLTPARDALINNARATHDTSILIYNSSLIHLFMYAARTSSCQTHGHIPLEKS